MDSTPELQGPDLRRRESLLRKGWPLLVLLALALAYHGQLIFTPPRLAMSTGDLNDYLLWVHSYAKECLLAGELPLWNPYNYGGMPLLANPQATVFYPPSWLYLLMPVGYAQKLLVFGHVLFTGIFMFLLVRRMGPGRVPALLAAIAWMFSSYFGARAAVGHLTLLMTASWLPATLYCWERALASRQWRWVFWTGMALGVSVLAGGDQNCYYTALTVGLYGLVRWSWPGKDWAGAGLARRLGGWLARYALVGVVAILTSAVQLAPSAEMAAQSDRQHNTYEFATGMSYHPASAAGFLLPWSDRMARLEVNWKFQMNLNWELAGYVGLLTLVLAAVSFAVRGSSPLRAARAVGVMAILLMLGRYTPLYRLLLEGLPGLKIFRIPGRAVLLADWSLCVMAAYGMAWLADPEKRRWQRGRWRPVAIGLLVALGATLATLSLSGWLVRARYPWSGANLTAPFMMSIVLLPMVCIVATAAVLLLWRWMSRPAMLASAVLLLIVNMAAARPFFYLAPFDAQNHPAIGRMKELAAQVGQDVPFRMDLAGRYIQCDAAMAAGVENLNAYWPVAPGRLYRYVHAMTDCKPSPYARHDLSECTYSRENPFPYKVLNVAVATTITTVDEEAEVEASADGVRDRDAHTDKIANDQEITYHLHVRSNFMPRAWLVHETKVVPDPEQVLGVMKKDDFDPARTILLESPPRIEVAAPSPQSPQAVTVRCHPHGGLSITTDSDAPAYLAVSEQCYPGWVAMVDGRPVEPEPADYVISAIPLPPGQHTIEWVYRPTSIKWGLAGSGLALLAALAVLAGSVVSGLRRRG